MTERKEIPNIDPALLRGLTMRRMSRRDLFRSAGVGVGAISLASILAACGSSDGGDAPAADTGGTIDWNAEPSGTLDFANWPLYIDKGKENGTVVRPSLLKFTEDTGIEVNYREVIQGNQSFFGKIQPQLAAGQSTGYDLMVITNGETITRLLQLDYVVEIPSDMHPNFDKYAGEAVKDPSYDPGNKHTLAWQSGLTGIAWDPKQVAELRPDNPQITTFMDLFDPAFAGKVGMLGDNADMPNLTLLGMGVIPQDSTPEDWQAAADTLTKQRDDGIVRQYYEQNYINALSNGDVAVTMGWSGDIFQTNLTGDSEGLQFTVPEEGAIIWTDNMCIPKGAAHPVDALTYMDYVYLPEVAATIEDWVNYICPVPAAQKIIATKLDNPDVANSPLVFPTPQDTEKLHTYRVLTEDEQLSWNNLFQPIYQS